MLRSPIFYFIIFIFLLSCEEKKTIVTKIPPSKKDAINFRQKGIENFDKKNFNVSFYNFNKAKIAYETLKDSANIVFCLTKMASIQQINGDYYGSKETLTETLPYIKKRDIYTVSINTFFGIADKELALYNDAIYYYKEAMKDCTDSITKQIPFSNIAVVYIQQKKYDDAITILEAILNKVQDSNSAILSKARIKDNLGYAYFKKGLNDKGFSLMNEGLEMRKKDDDIYGSIESNLHLAEYFSKIDSKKANQHALEAYKTATKLNSIDERLRGLQFLILNNSGTESNHYAQKYITLNDSIIKIRNNFKNKFAKIKYDSKKEKDENQKLRLEKAENQLSLERAQFKQFLFIVIFCFLGILIFYLRKYYRKINRIEKIKTAYDTETRIAKDIHDELANDVFNTITYTQTQPLVNEDNKEMLLQKLDHIYSRVRGISRENNDVDTGPNYAANLKEMLSTYNSNQTNVIIKDIERIDWNSIEDFKKIAIQRVLHELMVNMKKHSEATVVVVKFENNSNNLSIDYSDNGKGCEKAKIIKNGLQNMENRILATNGTITFDTEPDKGFKVKITMTK
ncbi:ATP-binding protein [Flavobacterium foetidum]|uniref:ATP-binding protein n=1 Tax=Flavobacterium foetidum TaxID=2026681 RepID=UPI0010756DA3|nr:ATP-binding protein [Flavobacterium foetidum]KAF2517190.1 ATP-binding protein [Flavobacterium foetidum]